MTLGVMETFENSATKAKTQPSSQKDIHIPQHKTTICGGLTDPTITSPGVKISGYCGKFSPLNSTYSNNTQYSSFQGTLETYIVPGSYIHNVV